ncbi:MAG: hypothetical protein IJS61_09755 [Firmicutes bacterium]|nr:hypothetical protein [Bacillota bacterium]
MKEMRSFGTKNFGGGGQKVKLSVPILFIVLCEGEKIENKIKYFMKNETSTGVVQLFTDIGESLIPCLADSREAFYKRFTEEKEDIEKKLEGELFSIINSFKSESFESDSVQIVFVFDAAAPCSCTLKDLSESVRNIALSAFRYATTDFYCIYDESLLPGEEGKIRDANKFLTFTELDEMLPKLSEKGMDKTCYLISNRDSEGKLFEFDLDEYLYCICRYNILRLGVSRENDNRFLGTEFREDIFKINCREKNPEGKFFSLGILSLKKDERLIRNVIVNRLLDGVLSKSDRIDIKSEINTLTLFNTSFVTAEEKVENFLDKINEEPDPAMFYYFCRNPIDLNTDIKTNGECVKKIYGKAIERFVDANINFDTELEGIKEDFKKELMGKLSSLANIPNVSVNDIVAFLSENSDSVKNTCANMIEGFSKEVSDKKLAFERFKARSADDGDINEKAPNGESMFIFTLASKYCGQYIDIKKSEIKARLYIEFKKIAESVADKYLRSLEIIRKLKKEYEAFIENRTASLKLRPDDIIRKGVVPFYSEVTDRMQEKNTSRFTKYFSDVNSALLGVELNVKDLENMINTRTKEIVEFIYENEPILSMDFSDECRLRLSGSAEGVNSMIKEEILSNRGYYSYISNFTVNEYETIGILGGKDDPAPRYLLGNDGLRTDKHAFIDESIGNDMSIIYIKGSHALSNIVSFERWKEAAEAYSNV